ncbi:acylphosphatase [uncultured Shewanella sp.]|uniref:acylphosphatase n=1 Tax=uncultured Shewanella sp. TaxID=173975 RepID=UPI00260B40BA|nr:acylphosphatase [uncultured Shewanella sp.]
MTVRTLKAVVTGRVQGVFYRVSVKEVAATLSIHGFAKNLMNGDVEVEATGQEEDLMAMVDYLKQGPVAAKVDTVVWEYSETKSVEGFLIL